ncbi:exodeoxyribonuclease III [Brumimicrobium aurantiacum]|uniref:Exodeoxyribonuclease III n=1 Tax=Brumimicrobium aurantiacum TaxID=1737063 RepID=A0A3E1EX65_9FLAO|nr:exodeoxyribonuclease III [Brumimicrobium aurantiacum]RFC54122.1 exodeoxyribonuclease III [Brumimicrobium aurantiacum]
MAKLISFNVNGIRAIMKKDFEADMKALNPDILCLQETKAQDDQVQEALVSFKEDYHIVSNSAMKKGYSGTAILSKEKPLDVIYGIGVEEHDQEGRVIAAEFQEYYVVVVYVPNAKNDLSRLDYRTTWDQSFLNFLKDLEAKKPVVVCGDFNVAHRDIDLARPKANYNKGAGYTQKEIDGMDAFTGHGLLDTFRLMHPEEVKYSWWSYRGGARGRNVGWRIDYFLVSESLKSNIKNADILNDVMGSDHCPVLLELG